MADMYAKKEGKTYTLRQERFRAHLNQGFEHPHDVCVVATSAQQLHDAVHPLWPDADFSAVADELMPVLA